MTFFKEIATSKSDVPRNEIKPKSHACSKCKKTFSKVSLLNRHMKLHLGIKPYQCTVRIFGAFSCVLFSLLQVCGWRFLQSYNLKKHLLTHSKKDLRCSQCKASFKDQNTLKEHVQRRHSNQGTVAQIKVDRYVIFVKTLGYKIIETSIDWVTSLNYDYECIFDVKRLLFLVSRAHLK